MAHHEQTIPVSNTKFLIRNWWIYSLIGFFMIASGIWVLITPLQSYITLAMLFSILTLVSGIFEIVFSLSNAKEYSGWGWYLASGIVDLLIGIVLVLHPSISIEILPFLLGFWLMYRGAIAVGSALEWRSHHTREWWILLLSGIFVILFSVLILLNPLLGDISIVVMTALAFIMAGILRMHISLKLKKMRKAELV